MNRADATMHSHVATAIENDLVAKLQGIIHYNAVADIKTSRFQIGGVEDANVLIQNSLWLNVPLGQLHNHQQVVNLQDRSQWAHNQLEQIDLLRGKFDEIAQNVIRICI